MNGHSAPAGVNAGRRVLVPEKVSQEGLALLSGICEVDVKPGLSADELLACIGQYQGLIIRSETQVNAKVLQAAKQLKVVARAGVGVDNIDVDAATANGVIVVNSPSGNIAAAAEHTIALLLATARNVGRADSSVKNGKWERSQLVGAEVGGKTLGIVGLGKVGFKVARMAIGLGMKVSAMDPYANADMANRAGVTLVPTLQDLLPISDFFTIHTPLLASTLDLLGEAEFKTMQKTARVLNVARGGVYNEAALLKALDEGWITGAGIDVFTSEPPEKDSTAAKLAAHPKVVATPHLGASTVEAQENVSLDVCAQVAEIMRGGVPTSAVNAPLILPEEYRKLQPFVKLIEKMGGLYTQTQALFSNRGKRRRSGSSVGSGVMAGRRFELIYQGELASIKNTRPLLAALVKGLVSSISDSGGREVNIVNASLIAKEKGLIISETHSPVQEDLAYASLVTLRASYRNATGHIETRVIEGYAAANQIYVSRLDRFTANFHPEGTLIVLHNYDEPGKIGGVGGVLGGHRINILFMQVASLDLESKLESGSVNSDGGTNAQADANGGDNEALMILGVAGQITKEVLDDLDKTEGILGVSLVRL